MADIREQLRLDIDGAIADIDRIQARVRANPITAKLDLDADPQAFRTVDETLERIERNVSDVNREIADIAVNARSGNVQFTELAQSLGQSEDAARRLASEVLEADRAARQIDDAARDVARQLGLADDDARRFANELGRASREAAEVDDRLEKVGRTAARLRAVIVGAVAAFGVRGIVTAANSAIDSFNLLNESVNAVNVTFGDGADTVFEFGENVARTAGLAQGQFQQLVVPVGALLRNFGFDAQQAGQAAVTLTQRAADLASVFNTDVTVALEAIQAGLRGEANPLERFGAGLSAARVEAKALELGLAATKSEITDLDRVTARYNLILSDTARVQGDFAKTAEDPANAARILASQFEDARAALGGALIPAFRELLELGPGLIESIEGLGPAIGGIAEAAVAAAPGVVTFLQDTLTLVDRLTSGLQLAPVRDELEDTLESAERGIGDLARAIFLTDLDEQFNALFVSSAEVEAQFTKVEDAFNDLKDELDSGVPPSEALAAALGEVGREATLTESAIEIFARRAGLSGQALATFLAQFRDSSQAIGLTDDELDAVTQALIRLQDELAFPAGSDPFAGIVADFAVFPDTVSDGIITLAELRDAAAAAGVSIQEALGSDLFPSGTVFDVFAQTEVEVANFRDRVNQIGREIDPLKGATEQLEISRADFVANLTAAFEQEATFEANLTRLGQRGFDALEDKLRELGPGASDLVVEFLNNAADAAAAEDVLDASANRFADGLANSLREEFTGSLFTGLPNDLARALTQAFESDPGTGFDSLAEKQARAINQGLRAAPAQSELRSGGRDAGEQAAQAFADRVAELAPEVGYDAALDIARALTTGPAADQAATAGGEFAAIFSRAFTSGVRFDFTPPSFPTTPTGTDTGGSSGSSGGSTPVAQSITVDIDGVMLTDLPTALTQAEQAAQTIGVLLK